VSADHLRYLLQPFQRVHSTWGCSSKQAGKGRGRKGKGVRKQAPAENQDEDPRRQCGCRPHFLQG
jgi:hypothetical protein